jgi:GAF domain-containing protein
VRFELRRTWVLVEEVTYPVISGCRSTMNRDQERGVAADMPDEGDFFREFTLHICGSMNIGEALWHCLPSVRAAMPADELLVAAYNWGQRTLEILVRADQEKFTLRSDRISIPQVSGDPEAAGDGRLVTICNDIRQDSIGSLLGTLYRWSDSSLIVERLTVRHRLLGCLMVRANGRGRYTDEDARLLALVNGPTGIALSNSRRYSELAKLKVEYVF